ncbi:MAG TPA: lipoate--protein ligase [Prolixibacteraceae bacterium]|nr:lipoate--protein ligase [Prolixibacteraceae bacterium]
MLLIQSASTKPAFNLAAEEYLFRNFEDDIFFLYINSPSVVVGKHQNALAEINPAFIKQKGAAVIRRLSGGGAVYHDLGNLNFSFHQTVADTAKVSFKKFNTPIVEALQQMGIAAQVGKRNDIFVKEFKVSGHAEHVFRKRVLSHGTLLFDAEKTALSEALKNPSFNNFEGKAIQSVRSKVANIVDFMENPISIGQFTEEISQHILNTFNGARNYELSNADNAEIEKLSDEKYSKWEWNFGYSPKYRFEKTIVNRNLETTVSFEVEKGIITEISIKQNGSSTEQTGAIQILLLNCPHEFYKIEKRLIAACIKEQARDSVLSCLF